MAAQLSVGDTMRLVWPYQGGEAAITAEVISMDQGEGPSGAPRLALLLELKPPPPSAATGPPTLAADDPANPYAGRRFARDADGYIKEVKGDG